MNNARFTDLLGPLIDASIVFYDALFNPLGDFISTHASKFTWLVDLLERSNLGGSLLNASLGSILLGSALIVVLIIAIIQFFIP